MWSGLVLDIPIEGMTCDACPPKIREALLRADGVQDALIDRSFQGGVVMYAPDRTTPTEVMEAIELAGFSIRSRPRSSAPRAAGGGILARLRRWIARLTG